MYIWIAKIKMKSRKCNYVAKHDKFVVERWWCWWWKQQQWWPAAEVAAAAAAAAAAAEVAAAVAAEVACSWTRSDVDNRFWHGCSCLEWNDTYSVSYLSCGICVLARCPSTDQNFCPSDHVILNVHGEKWRWRWEWGGGGGGGNKNSVTWQQVPIKLHE